MKLRILELLLAAGAFAITAPADTVFTFDTDSLGTATTFTDTVNGTSATFSSSADPGGFSVQPSFFDTLTGNVLGDPGPAGATDIALNVAFSQNLSALSFNFATADFVFPSPLDVNAYENGTLVGTVESLGSFITGFTFPEGKIAFNGATFNSIQISSLAPEFAVDNIAVTPTPEPRQIVFLAAGLAAIVLFARRGKLRLRSAWSAGLLSVLMVGLGHAQDLTTIFPMYPASVSTIASNGDVNPYGVVFVPKTVAPGGGLQPGDILVSNFNNSFNLQGLGTTIVRVTKSGSVSTFYTGSASQPGLTAAIGILSNGVVLIGNLPTSDGTPNTVRPGQLAVLGSFGQFAGTIGRAATVDGPWAMAVYDTGTNGTGVAHVFLSNVLSGVVSRFDITYTPSSLSAGDLVLANGFNHRTDPAALVLGPSGLAYDRTHDVLFVASSVDNAIYEIPHAATTSSTQTATLVFTDLTHLHGPLGLTILPNGHLLVANSDGSNVDPNQPSELVEFSPTGQFLGQMPIDPNNGGAFGVAINTVAWGAFHMAYVDDNANALRITTAISQ